MRHGATEGTETRNLDHDSRERVPVALCDKRTTNPERISDVYREIGV